MANLKEHIFEVYSKTMEISFYIFLFCTLSLGRIFSILYINTPIGPLFITEIFLLLNIPFLLFKYKSMTRLPDIFLIPISMFFIFGCCLLAEGLIEGNMLVLRDITLCAYILFLPITFIHLSNLSRFKLFIGTVILSNIFNLLLGWGFFLQAYPLGSFYHVAYETRIFNLGLYHAMAISFIASFYECIKSKACRLLALVVLSLNIITIILYSMSSIWIATFALLAFLFVILKVKFLKLCYFFILTFIFMSLVVFYFRPSLYANVFNEEKGFGLISQGIPKQNEPMKKLSDVKAISAGASYRDKLVNELSESPQTFGNIAWRLGIWKQTLRFASDSLLIGKGFGVYPVYEIWGTHQYPHGIYLDSGIVPAHNHIVTIFFKMGILGLGLFLFVNIFIFVYALSYLNRCNLLFVKNLLVSLLGIFVFWHTLALLFDMIDSPPTSIFLWVIIGAIFAAIGVDKNYLLKKGV